ncbi:MAG TPA: hypothetical protein VID94_09665, partial [Acidimicrobiales bacterium]
DRGPSTGARSPRRLDLAEVPDDLAVELDQIVDTDALADLPGFDTEALDKMAQRLVDFERWISERRHVVQGVVDTLQAEIARRYRDGEATVDGLLD